MKIMGLDLSTIAGVALWDTASDYSAIMTGLITLEGDTDFHRFASAGRSIRYYLKEYRPDFVVIETPLQGGKNVRSVVQMNFIAGAVCSVLDITKTGFGFIAIPTWRKSAYGEGFKPEMVTRINRKGERVTEPEDWGDIAVRKCRQMGIELPTGADKHNAAEAALIATAWPHAKPQGAWSVEEFRRCRSQRNERNAA